MLEILTILGILVALFFLGGLLKGLFALFGWLFEAVFWVIGAFFQLLLLPFQLLGGLIAFVVLLPLLIIGVPLLVVFGVPLLVIGGFVLAVLIFGVICSVVSALFGLA